MSNLLTWVDPLARGVFGSSRTLLAVRDAGMLAQGVMVVASARLPVAVDGRSVPSSSSLLRENSDVQQATSSSRQEDVSIRQTSVRERETMHEFSNVVHEKQKEIGNKVQHNQTSYLSSSGRQQESIRPSVEDRSLAIKDFEAKKSMRKSHDNNESGDGPSKELYVPATRVERVFGFGRLAAGLAWGAASSRLDRLWNGSDSSSSSSIVTSVESEEKEKRGEEGSLKKQVDEIVDTFLSDANAERLADGLSRLRGAALKLGQLLSMQDENVIPTALSNALERVRAQADFMPSSQKDMVLAKELGDSWREKFREFEEKPFAAASIGQVHRATLHDDTPVVVKIQYPGVGLSIESDIDNLVRLVQVTNMIPKGLYLEHAVEVAKEELRLECDYRYEAESQSRFNQLLEDDESVMVPNVINSLSTERVLVTTFFDGIHIDKCGEMPQSIRDDIATRILKITLRELWEFQFMQTDPNYANFLYDPVRDVIGMIDFGAAKAFRKEFTDAYGDLVLACANGDGPQIIKHSVDLGFLTGDESKALLDAHVAAGMVVGRPFAFDGFYDFGDNSTMTRELVSLGSNMVHNRLTSPPPEAYALHRRLSGAFLVAMKLKARVPCRELLLEQLSKDSHESIPKIYAQ